MTEMQDKVDALRDVLIEHLGSRRARNFTDTQIKLLVDAGFVGAEDFIDAAKTGGLQSLDLPVARKNNLQAGFQDLQLEGAGAGGGAGGGGGPGGVDWDAVYEKRLDSASTISKSNSKFLRFCKDVSCSIGRTWPGQTQPWRATPITAAAEPFAQFSTAAARDPSPDACKLAQQLYEILVVIYSNEVKEMQVQLEPLVKDLLDDFPGVQITQAKQGAEAADYQIFIASIRSVPILFIECKLDTGGNTLGQALKYLIDALGRLRTSEEGWQWWATCTPVFILELSGNRVRFTGAARQDLVMAESLLDITVSSDEASMRTLACGLQGLREGLRCIISMYERGAPSQEQAPSALHRAAFPQFLSEMFPNRDVTFSVAFKSNRMWFVNTPTSSREAGVAGPSSSSSNSSRSLVKLVRAGPGNLALQAHERIAAVQDESSGHTLAPKLLSPGHRVSPEWWAVHMQLLRPEDGWYPLDVLHPKYANRPRDIQIDWKQISEAAKEVLARIHELRLPKPDKPGEEGPLVWGDARLANMLAKYFEHLKSWRVVVIDLDWAGVGGVSKYPCTMNHTLKWQGTAGPGEIMQQENDRLLLNTQLHSGGDFAAGNSDVAIRRKRRHL